MALVKTGIFGGAFNPPHVGHLAMADEAKHILELDKVIFVPTGHPPHKMIAMDDEHRLRMVMLALDGIHGFTYSDFETDRNDVSFTVDTLMHFQDEGELFLIMGTDQAQQFDIGWKDPETIRDLATCVAIKRNMDHMGVPMDFVRISSNPAPRVSSTEIRRRIFYHEPWRFLVPKPVYEYIRRHRLYENVSPVASRAG